MNKIRQQEAVTSTCNEAERASVNDLRNSYHHHHRHRHHHQHASLGMSQGTNLAVFNIVQKGVGVIPMLKKLQTS